MKNLLLLLLSPYEQIHIVRHAVIPVILITPDYYVRKHINYLLL